MKGSKSIAVQLIRNYRKGSNRKIRNQLGLKPLTFPYMKFKEIDMFKEILIRNRPKRILEYGCGFSTLYFPQFIPKGGLWYSIEHHEEWYGLISDKLGQENKRVRIHLVKADDENELMPEDKRFDAFVNYPDKLGKFDIILVDGMARNSCIAKSHELLNKNGLLIVHDTNRTEYHPEIKKFAHWMIFTDFRKTSGGIAFASNDRPIDSYFDIAYHSKLWSIDTSINNFFKFKFLIGKNGKPLKIQSSDDPH